LLLLLGRRLRHTRTLHLLSLHNHWGSTPTLLLLLGLLLLLLLLLGLQLCRSGTNRAISADQHSGATGAAGSNTALGSPDLLLRHIVSQLIMVMGKLFLGLNLGLFMGELRMQGLHAGENLRLRRKLLLRLLCRRLLLHQLLLLHGSYPHLRNLLLLLRR
jgi:hypothetical protein